MNNLFSEPKRGIDIDKLHRLIEDKSRTNKGPDLACASALGLADVMPVHGNAIWPIANANYLPFIIRHMIAMTREVGMEMGRIDQGRLVMEINERIFHCVTYRRYEWTKQHTWDGIVHTGNESQYPEGLDYHLYRLADANKLFYSTWKIYP